MTSPSTVKKPSRRGLFLPFLLVLLLGLGWTGWWFLAASRINAGVDAWIAEQKARGAEVSYAARRLTGYPFRFELVLDRPAFRAGPGQPAWEGDRAEFVMQAWNLKHMIGRVPGHNVITGADGIRNSIDLGREAAFSLSWDGAGLRRFGLQSGAAAALVHGQVYEVRNLSLNLAPRPESPDDLMVALQWEAIGLEEAPQGAPYLGPEIGPSRLIGEVRGFFPAFRAAGQDMGGVWPALLDGGGGIEVAQALLDWGPLDLGATAELELAGGRANGAFNLRLEDAAALRQAMMEAGAWTQQAQMLIGTLEPASRNGGFLTLPVIDNRVFVGPVPLGDLPGRGS